MKHNTLILATTLAIALGAFAAQARQGQAADVVTAPAPITVERLVSE